ncbi:MAG TPA: hypothetical protein VIK89_00510, partial [Cytophagaceae bacterium]
IEVQYGGGSALFGSGAIGGTIHLNNKPEFNKGIQAGVSTSYGSFERWHQTLDLKISRKKIVSSLKLYNYSAENNFPFINTALPGNPEVRQRNARVEQQGLLFENYFKIKQNQQLDLRLWLQDNFRQVPPSMLGYSSIATLENRFTRIAGQWKRAGRKATLFVRSAYFNEFLPYSDSLINIHANSHFQSSITEVESNIYLTNNQLLNIGINNTYNLANSDGYENTPTQNRTALFASYKLQNQPGSWKGVACIRQEAIKKSLMPVMPSIGVEGSVVKGVKVKANISRNYRVPTFNDLYWRPGGNPDLKPESEWSEELSVIVNKPIKNTIHDFGLTFFNSNVNNRILWLPYSGYWTPRNIQAIWSRGLECQLKSSLKVGQVRVELSMLYNYVVSTNEKASSINDNSLKKQLIYVPIYSGQGVLALYYRKLYLNYIHNYVGNRFTSTDNTAYIEAYQLGHITLSQNFSYTKFRFNLHVKVNNLWNESYQVVLWQAMPLRNYQAGISVYFNQ